MEVIVIPIPIPLEPRDSEPTDGLLPGEKLARDRKTRGELCKCLGLDRNIASDVVVVLLGSF